MQYPFLYLMRLLHAGQMLGIQLIVVSSTRVKREIIAVQLLKTVVLKVLKAANIILGVMSVIVGPP